MDFIKKNITSFVSHHEELNTEKQALADLHATSGDQFPGSDFHPANRKTWMSELDTNKLIINQIVWPGTHDSATNDIGIAFVTAPFARCQSLSIYDQLVLGTRVLDIRIQEERKVCHGILVGYHVDVVIEDVKRFLAETETEVIILEIRTEFGHQDPTDFDKYLIDQLGEFLIPQDDAVFGKTVQELLPKRVICIWKPRNSPAPGHGSPLWSAGYLKDNWIDTDKPKTKFDSNLKFLGQQPRAAHRNYFYRVENTVTPNVENPLVHHVTDEIHGYARLFISQACAHGIVDRLQVFSSDFIDEDFVDACVALTKSRIHG